MKSKNESVDRVRKIKNGSRNGKQVQRGTSVLSVDKLQARAYEIYVERGRVPGFDLDHWLQAEQELSAHDN